MGIMIGALGFVFSALFHQDIAKTLPYIATGIIFWGLLTGCINEGTTVFIVAESYIRNLPMPLSVHFYRMMARNVMIWGFNMAIYVVVVVCFGPMPGWNALLFIPGFILFLHQRRVDIAGGRGALHPLSRYSAGDRQRDPGHILRHPDLLVARNPAEPAGVCACSTRSITSIEIVRAPLLGAVAPPMSWGLCAGMALAGCGFTAWLYRRAHARIAYWV